MCRRLLLSAAVAGVLALAGATARAQTFASFAQAGPGNPFSYSQGAVSLIAADGSFVAGTVGSPVPVTLDFLNGYGGVLSGPAFSASMELSGVAAGSVVGGAVQPVSIPTLIFKYTGAAMPGVNPGDLVLTMVAGPGGGGTGGLLVGSGSSGSILGSQPGDSVSFTSSVDGSIATLASKGYSLSLTPTTPITPAAGDSDFNNFNAGIAGVFSGSAASVPEPATCSLIFCMGTAGAMFRARRPRRR